MKLAVLLLSCTGTPRTTDFDQAWVHRLVGHTAGYWIDQTGGRVNMEFRVLDWFQLPHTSDQWNALGFGAGPVVKPLVAAGTGIDLSPYDHFALVIDKFDAASAAVSPSNPEYVHVGAQSLDPALLAHEMGHFFGAAHANLDTPAGPREYDDQFCIMGREGGKYSFVHTPLNRPRSDGTFDVTLSDTGPGLAAPALRACGWLDLAGHGINISAPLKSGTRRTTIELPALRGAPVEAGQRVCAYADGVVPGQRLLLEYRARDGWDRGMPPGGAGWVVAHLTEPTERSRMSLQVGAVKATPGSSVVTSKGSVLLSVGTATASTVSLTVEVMSPVPVNRAAPAVASWGPNRIDIFARGLDKASFHKAWAQGWFPSQNDWEAVGGGFTSAMALESWGKDRLDAFGVGLDQAMWHKAWAGGWSPGQSAWEPLGGAFVSPPAVTSWGQDRLDIFALGTDRGMWHKAWAQRWSPSQNDWEPLGGAFLHPPAVASWGPGRLDVFGVGLDKAMFHKAWKEGWQPSGTEWEFLGGGFTSQPAVCSWGPDRLDVFALGLDASLWHKAWAPGWFPSQNDWEPLGGKFLSPPAVASWGPGRLDVFGVGLDGAMYHRAFDGGWHGWEQLGGIFSSPPTVVSWAAGRLDIFAVGKDKSMWHKAWAKGWSPSQTGWEPIGGGFL
ncbi:hypothetical protein [Nocardioides sp. NPDC006273]|uniref:hypothetical protein n=1 Tax=Nocardioides sp. NPDC006273 TaxID=3155598 RepID=UPI0033AFBE5F